CLEIVAHDRTSRCAAGDLPEASTRERRDRARKDVRRAVRNPRVDRIGFERRCTRALCSLQSGWDKLRHDPLPTIAFAHEETGDRPDRQRIDTLEPRHAIKPWQGIPRRELTPTDCQVAFEGEQAWRTGPHDLS